MKTDAKTQTEIVDEFLEAELAARVPVGIG
jgi:hypothetical protein